MTVDHRSNPNLLDELRAAVAAMPRKRLHVHPDAAMWMVLSVGHARLSEHVQVVSDPACTDVGRGWIENLTVDQWRRLRSLVGQQVILESSELGIMRGELLRLDHRTAMIDVGGQDVRYLSWITIKAVTANPEAAEYDGVTPGGTS
jgi:hypothetical protein